MRTFNIFILLFFTTIGGVAFAGGFESAVAADRSAASLGAVLDREGHIRPGAAGSFDGRGYRMSLDQTGAPRFTPAANILDEGRRVDTVAAAAQSPALSGWWDSRFYFARYQYIYAVAVDGNTIYVGGDFTRIGGVAANRVAKWNGTAWSALGAGVDKAVYALALSGGDLYVGGEFSQAGNQDIWFLAKWDGSTWSSLGQGVNGTVWALTASGGALYVGGSFTYAGPAAAKRIAKWDGAVWSALGGGTSGTVYAIAVDGAIVYAGGAFSLAGGVAGTRRVAKFENGAWSALGNGLDYSVYTLAALGNKVFAGGNFRGLLQWDGLAWSTTGCLTNGYVNGLAVKADRVYAVGHFSQVGDQLANNIACWDGAAWSALGEGVGQCKYGLIAVAVGDAGLCAVGDHQLGGYSEEANRLAWWDGAAWSDVGGFLSDGVGQGVDARVYSLSAGSSGVFAAGEFSLAGSVPVSGLARWDGAGWNPLGLGVHNGASGTGGIRNMTAAGTDLYVVGRFPEAGGILANNVARWDGLRWRPLGAGISLSSSDYLSAVAVSGNDVYVGGRFPATAEISANIAKWNGTTWSGLGAGVDGPVRGIAVKGGEIYVVGDFFKAGGVDAKGVAKWDGAAWSAVGDWQFRYIHAIAIGGNDVYIGGAFTEAGGAPGNQVAKWDGVAWSALGTGVQAVGSESPSVEAMTYANGKLYIAGGFGRVGSLSTQGAACWDGAAWSALGAGVGGYFYSIFVQGEQVYLGGSTAGDSGSHRHGVVRWDGANWFVLGSGMSENPYAVAAIGDTVFAGGAFYLADGQVVNSIAAWDGQSWSGVGAGVSEGGYPGQVRTATAQGSDVYVGGLFWYAGETEARNIAKWDGAAWSALGQGVDGEVFAIAANGADVYVGGEFFEAGTLSAFGVAKWDGAQWTSLQNGVQGKVNAIVGDGNNVYVGGEFYNASGCDNTYCLARWDGNAWFSVGGGLSFTENNVFINALAVWNGQVYAGGSFSTIGNVSAKNIARWDGQAWHPLGEGIDSYVYSLCATEYGLFVGGHFSTAGGLPVNSIARWDGQAWAPLAEGITDFLGDLAYPGDVLSLASQGAAVFAGGYFAQAGAFPSHDFAVWHNACEAGDAPTIVTPPSSGEVVHGQSATLTVTVSGAHPLHYAWYQGVAPDTGTPAPGATDSPTYATLPLTQDASFWVRVSNACGAADSAAAALTVRHAVCAAHAASSDFWWTRLTLLNTGDSDNPIDLKLYGSDGQRQELQTLSALAPGSVYSADLAEIFSPAALSSDLWVTAESRSPLEGTVEFGTRDGKAYVVMPLEKGRTSRLVFPYVVILGEWYTGITLLNLGSAPAQLQLTALKEDGTLLAAVSASLAPGAKFVRLVNQAFPEIADPTTIRFLKVTADQPLVGFELFGNLGSPGLAGLPAYPFAPVPTAARSASPAGTAPAVDHTLLFPEIPPNDQYYTGVTFSTLDPAGAAATAELLDLSGSALAQGQLNLPPQAQVTREIWSVFDGLPRPTAASLRVSSAVPLIGFELFLSRSAGDAFRFDGLSAIDGGATRLRFPLVKTGAEWRSDLRVVNTGLVVNTLTVKAYGPDGTSWGTFPVSLAPGAKLEQPLSSMFPGPVDDIAWLTVEGSEKLAGSLFMVSADLTRCGSYAGIPDSALEMSIKNAF